PRKITSDLTVRLVNTLPSDLSLPMTTGPFISSLRRLVSVGVELACFDVAGVLLNVGVPLLGKVVESEDRRNRADWHTGAAVDALDRVDEELVDLFEPRAAVLVLCVLLRMDAVHWTGIHTGRIF